MILLMSFLTSLAVTTLTVPLTIKLAKKFDLMDNPKERPHPAHIQNRTVPRAGGLPIAAGLLIPTLLFLPQSKYILGIESGITLLLLVGLADDLKKNFSPYPRLVFQFLAATAVVASGIGISFVTNPLGGILRLDQVVYPINFLGTHNIVVIADLFAIVWIVWMMNVVNWAKGVDGQMPGITAVAALTIGILSYNLFTKGDPSQLNIAILSFITAGAAAGFLAFNWFPSKIFPGFSGSTIMGFLLATLSILSGAKLATALLVMLIPSVDFFYTFFRRILEGRTPFRGDQKHLHHLLLKCGWNHWQISLFYITTCAILGLLAANLTSQGKLFTLTGLGIMFMGTILWLHLFSKNLR